MRRDAATPRHDRERRKGGRVSVVIVGFRNVADVASCIEALGRSSYRDFDVVICENGGPAAYRDLVATLPTELPGGQSIRLLEASQNLGYAGGVNLAITHSPEVDAWWILNPDTQVSATALEACVRRLQAGDCDAVGCTIQFPDGRVQSHGGLWRTTLARAVSLGYGTPSSRPVDRRVIERKQSYLNGACMMVSRRFVECVGLMREEYFLYCEEVEWFLRARARGLKLGYAPDARVLHEAGTTTGSAQPFREMPKTPIYLNERNRLLVTRDVNPWLLPVVSVTAFAMTFARFARRGAWPQLGYALQGWAAGIAGRRGPPKWISPGA